MKYVPGNERRAAATGAEPRPAAVPAMPQPVPAHGERLIAQTTCRPQLPLGRERAASMGYKHVLKIKCLARASIRSPELDTGAIKLREHFVKL